MCATKQVQTKPSYCLPKYSVPSYRTPSYSSSPINFMNNATNQKPINTVYGSNLVNSNNTSNHTIQNQGLFYNFGNLFNGNINLGQILSCFKKPVCTPKPKCQPKPKCPPKPVCPEKPKCPPKPPEVPTEGTNIKGRIWGDPHVEWTKDCEERQNVEFYGHGNYELLEDKSEGLDIHAHMTESKWGEKTVIDKIGLALDGKKLTMDPSGKLLIDGVETNLTEAMTFGNKTLSKDGKNYKLATPKYNILFENENDHQNVNIDTGAKGIASLFKGKIVRPTGLFADIFKDNGAKLKGLVGDDGYVDDIEGKEYSEADLFEIPTIPTRKPLPFDLLFG